MFSNRRQIDITTYQIRKIKADTSLCLFADEIMDVGFVDCIVFNKCARGVAFFFSKGRGGAFIRGSPKSCTKLIIKGALTSTTSSLNFCPKSWDFYIMKQVGMGNDCMLIFMF